MTEIRAADLHRKWTKDDPAYREAFAAQEDEFALAAAMIGARAHAGLSQRQLAERMKTTQGVIAKTFPKRSGSECEC